MFGLSQTRRRQRYIYLLAHFKKKILKNSRLVVFWAIHSNGRYKCWFDHICVVTMLLQESWTVSTQSAICDWLRIYIHRFCTLKHKTYLLPTLLLNYKMLHMKSSNQSTCIDNFQSIFVSIFIILNSSNGIVLLILYI